MHHRKLMFEIEEADRINLFQCFLPPPKATGQHDH